MPQYYNSPDNWKKRGKIKVTYSPAWRNSFLGKLADYHVGDRVKFKIQIEKPNLDKYENHWVYESFQGRIRYFEINGTEREIEGNIIDAQGSISYSLGIQSAGAGEAPLLTAEVLNWDTVRYYVFWMIVSALIGAILTLVTGTVLGFVEIDKFWHIWQPSWFKNLFP